ncbi:MAG: hypothetical protein HZA53_04920 [Planctomycetes bacterium]|nr:hypothetical protein [Planctomycetota bacterium]
MHDRPSFLRRIALLFAPWLLVASALADERAELVRGVESIRTSGNPGSIAVWGEHAFVVVDGNGGGGTRVPLVGAGPMGKGRVVLFGHGYLSKGVLADAPTRTLVGRTLEWAARKRANAPLKLLAWDGELADVLDAQRFEVVRAKDGWVQRLAEVDAVLATRSDFTEGEVTALTAWLKEGGALLAGVPGWGWMQLHDRPLVTNEVNRIVAEAGLAFADGGCEPGKGKRFATDAPTELVHAGRAFAALAGDAKQLDKQARRQAHDVLMETLRVLPAEDRILRPRLAELLKDPTAVKLPTPEKPIAPDDLRSRVALAFQAVELASTPVEKVVAHPSAAAFPGGVPPEAKVVKKDVSIDLAVPRWHATGLYAAPGERVVVELPADAIGLGLEARIGVHTDAIWDKPWPRMPEIARAWKLDAPKTTVASPFGGLVELVVPRAKKERVGKVIVWIQGAVLAPLFVLGETSNEEWKKTVRARPGPWAELATSKVVLAVPSSSIRALDDPQALMEWWDRILDAMADFGALPRERASPERYVPDVMISAGYMHSGYPIMTFLDAVPDMTSLERMQKGPWGLLHELGHNHQESEWTFSGTGEVTNNVFVLYVLDVLCKRADWLEGHDALKKRAQRTEEYLKKGAQFEEWCGDPFLALGMYVELREAFGWAPFTKVFAEYRALAKSDFPKTDAEKRDQWLTRLSRAVGKDLGPFFERWGVPVSAEARATLRDLPGWK